VLKRINRGCTTADTVTALKRLKDACYKIDIHLMPNLPGATAAVDRAMFERVLSDPQLQADQWKVYPTQAWCRGPSSSEITGEISRDCADPGGAVDRHQALVRGGQLRAVCERPDV